MAEIVGSLFGITPDLYERQLRAQDEDRAIRMANLAPGARGAAMIQSGAAGLTRGLGGLLGAEDPQLKLITARQSIIGQLDQTDPTSLLRGAKSLSDMGDQQGAFALADYARKAQSEIAQAQQRMAAANRERQQATPNDIQIANELSTLQDTLDQLKAQPASPQRDRAMNLLTTRYTELQRLTTKPEKDLRFGTDRESISAELYDKPFATLTPAERGIVNKRVEDEQGRKAEKGAAKLTNVMPGQEKFADIPKFRADVQKTIAPQIESVNAADQALQAINDSITKNNFVSFNAARVQLAKALGDSQLSRRDVEQAGGDPSLFGKLLDSTSTLFTGTPTLETQNLIKNTLQAVKKVSTNKATREIDAQRQIAYSTPGYDKARVDLALKFPEFEATKQVDVSGDLAAQARALLKQRQEGKK
tara:strand:- start:3 stop:1259 length:1257 start_codon:yes stop_codon:yes gene_type:complete